MGPGNTDEEEKGSAAAALAGQIIWKDLSHLHNWEEKQSLEDNENPLSHLSPPLVQWNIFRGLKGQLRSLVQV